MSSARSNPLVAVVLAAGAGTRLRPLTSTVPKALCPINSVPLVDLSIEKARSVTPKIAVNVHYGREAMERHLSDRVYLSIETPEPLGTAGALGKLRDWIAGRDVLVLNADAWLRDDLTRLLAEWDRERIRLLTVQDPIRGDFGLLRYVGAALMPWPDVARLKPEPTGLYEESWAPAGRAGRLDLVLSDEPFFDCGTIADYHAANMAASAGENVIGEGAVVEGTIERTVLWTNVHVAPDEHLVDAIRARDDVTLFVTPAAVSDGR